MKSIIKEFKDFALRGNVIDLAIGVVIGTAFSKIVTSFVNDILMPPLGLLLGKVDFSNLFVNLSGGHYGTLSEAKTAGANTLNYGLFINSFIDFVIIAFAIFLAVRATNRLNRLNPSGLNQKMSILCDVDSPQSFALPPMHK